MKTNTILFFVLLALVLIVSVGCGENSKNDDVTSYASLPLTCGSGAQHAQLWRGHRQHGFFPYGNYAGYSNGYGAPRRYYQYSNVRNNSWGYNQNQSFCGCPTGFIPACDSDFGMTCVAQNAYSGYRYPIYNYNPNLQGFHFHGHGQIAPVRTQVANSCYNQVTVTCQVGDPGACQSTGGYCQPSRAGSPYGICVY